MYDFLWGSHMGFLQDRLNEQSALHYGCCRGGNERIYCQVKMDPSNSFPDDPHDRNNQDRVGHQSDCIANGRKRELDADYHSVDDPHE